jgi:NitT/TauT family transport system permease protein
VLFITHDLDEAIAMSDRVIVLAAGPGTHPIGEFRIDLPRPRDVAEIRMHPRFVELHQQIWDVLRDEVLKGYNNSAQRKPYRTDQEENQHHVEIIETESQEHPFLAIDGVGRRAAGLACGHAQSADRLLLRRTAEGGAAHLGVVHRRQRLAGGGRGRYYLLHAQLPGEIYSHLLVTLTETVLAFIIGTVFGLGIGLWLALSPTASAILDPYVKAANSMPRVILAPIFAMWFGLGIWSKVALAVTLVFFIVFFNVYQGVKEVSPVVLANARMLGANARQLLRTVYLPSATSWVFSSLHTSIGLAFVGAVVGEYLGSARGVGYLILQAEGSFDINTVFAGIVVLTVFALVLDLAVGVIEKRLMKWQPKSGETEKL